MNCYRYNSATQPLCGNEATHYVTVVFTLDDRWVDEGTNYNADYTCEKHISAFIDEHRAGGLEIIELDAKRL